MTKLNDVISEVHSLIDEQMKALKGKLTPEESADYRERNRKIEELLERIAMNHLDRN